MGTPELSGAEAELAEARARFADSRARPAPARSLGAIALRPDQLEAVRRVLAHLERDGGCLLADEVGTGKTYVALAVARGWQRPLIVLPASLRSTWMRAMRRASVECAVITHEALSRGHRLEEDHDGIVVDESHRFRATSRRHAALAGLTAFAPVVLLSATPLQNRASELAAQLALFLGEAAYRLDETQLTRWVVRGTSRADASLPRVAPPRWLHVAVDDGAVLRALLALPSPPRLADAGDGGALVQISLVRAWASSRAALVATAQRRLRTLVAIEQCHAEGRLPTRRELRSWRAGADVQLGFAALLADTSIDAASVASLASSILAERTALEALLYTIARAANPDRERVAVLRSVLATHQGAAVIAFSESASTVRAFFAALRAEPGVGMLTASEARIASGRLTRDELLARFAPRAQGALAPAPRERVTLLLATDVMSEGVNLQDASIVVHLDLPWNPARLAQRLGRVRRPGGAPEVTSYLMSPPARASLLLRAEARIRSKLARVERTIGRGLDVMPVLHRPHGHDGEPPNAPPNAPALATAELRGEIERVLAGWRRSGGEFSNPRDACCVAAAVSSSERGWVVLLDDGRLVACRSDHSERTPTEEPDVLATALNCASGRARVLEENEYEAAVRELAQWLVVDWSARSCGLSGLESLSRRRVLHTLDAVVRRMPRHRRHSALRSAALLRAAMDGPLPLGVERALTALVQEHGGRRDAGVKTSDATRESTLDRHERWLARATEVVARSPVVMRRVVAQSVAPAPMALIVHGPAAVTSS